MTLDYLIHSAYVVTMEGPGTGIINQGAVGIRNNKIEAVGESSQIRKQYRAHREIDASGKAILPGFVDVHMHTGDTIFRGCAQDLPGKDWMFKGILPLLGQAGTEDIRRGSMVNIVEALKTGTTTFGDFYYPMTELVKNHVKLGTRAVVSSMINQLPPDTSGIDATVPYPLDPAIGEVKLKDNIQLIEQYHESQNGRIQCRFGPHAPDMCSTEMLEEIKFLGDRYGVNFFTHLSQSPKENNQVLMRSGMRPTDLLEKLGYLNGRLMAAHMTYATDQEVERVAKSGAAFAFCCNSLCIIDGELPKGQLFAEYGGRVGFGTDQAPGNNCNIMLNEMKVASLLHKYKNGDPTVMPAWKALRMATIEAAQALCLGDKVGSLREGKLADLIIIDLSAPQPNPIMEAPVRNLIPNLVYAARGSEVESVMIDGRFVVEDHELKTADEKQILCQAAESAARIQKELGMNQWANDLPLARWTQEGYY